MQLLLIEDTPALAKALTRGLEENQFVVDVVTTARGADERLATDRYSVILLDLSRSHDNGLDLVRRWRSEGISTHVLMLSARTTVADRVAGLDAGADDYVTKPFAFEELLSRVKALIRRSQTPPCPEIRILDLTIDTATRKVGRAGRLIHLTPREYGLLEFLANHRGRVVTRTMIWEHLYDEYDKSTSNVVDVYIRYLRNKIDRGFDRPLILTKWGEGYMICDADSNRGQLGWTRPPSRQ